MFGGTVLSLTPDQLHFLIWCRFYKQIYEIDSDNRPSNDIIENDEELDLWNKEQFNKSKQESLRTKSLIAKSDHEEFRL